MIAVLATRSPPTRSPRCATLLGMLVLLMLMPGCSGCSDDLLRKKEKTPDLDAKKQLDPFESKELKVLPADSTTALQGVKPGHWFCVRQELKSNKADFYGELHCVTTNRKNEPIPLEQSNFDLHSNRMVSLPKGQSKTFELTFFASSESGASQSLLRSDLRPPLGGTLRYSQTQVGLKLRPYQNFFVVLARRPDSYTFVKTLHSIKPPFDHLMTGFSSDYVVVLPDASRNVPLPSWPLMWTAISYVVWDDFDPGHLSRTQQRAMIDWLHWGGQLIVSGPNSLDTLRSSFLAPYIPVRQTGSRSMVADDVKPLNGRWAIRSKNIKVQPRLELTAGTAPEVLEFELQSDGAFVPGTGRLLAERRVGRGRVVTTAFSLTARQMITWNRFDNFFNACLMRRPPRRFGFSVDRGVFVEWAGGISQDLTALPTREAMRLGEPAIEEPWVYEAASGGAVRRYALESLLNSKLRYFSRDTNANKPIFAGRNVAGWDISGYRYNVKSGVAGWSDFSGVSLAASESLTEAAGISVPDRRFILMSLALYLFVLVPANWTLFYLIGRVEWAWFSVPVIAIVGTYLVVRMAQLDIGFARSRTEIAIVETQPGYSRGHLTRYIGLYSSLSTNYGLSFDSDSALALPLATSMSKTQPSSQPTKTVDLQRVDRKGEALRLDELMVASNSTEMVHSEEFFDLGGPMLYREVAPDLFRVTNEGDYSFRDVVVLRRVDDRLQLARIDQLSAGGSVPVRFKTLAEEEQWTDSLTDVTDSSDSQQTKLDTLLRLALHPRRIQNGDVRMAGWSDEELPGLSISPSASQQTFRTVLVANLEYGTLPPPRSDENTASDLE